jgi:serine/threonine protein kinase
MENLQGGMLALEHRYTVDAEAGRQGLATVYRGTQHPFDRAVLIRAYDLFEESPDAETLVALVKQGAQRASVLDHEGILRVVDYGELSSDVPFVVCERGSGPTLAAFLEQSGTLTLEEVVGLVDRVGRIVDEAHMKNVVHGNLSSEVVILPQKDVQRAHVGQFALQIPMSEIRKIEGAMLSFGLVSGLAPELFAEGATPTRASDIYAIGTLAYMALSGQHPFFDDVNDTSEGLLAIQTGKARDLAEFGFSEAIWAALSPSLDRNPDARPECAQELADALREAAFPTPKTEVKAERERFAPIDDAADFDEDDDVSSPTPGAIAWGAILFVLILSNVAWFSYAGKESQAVEPMTEHVRPTVLRPGVEIDSIPSGARVSLQGDTPSVLGETPLAINPSIGANGEATLFIEKRGYDPLEVNLVPAADGNRLVIKLKSNTP